MGNLLADFQQRNAFLDEVPWFPSTHGDHTEELRAKNLEGGGWIEVNKGYPQIGSSADILKVPVKNYGGESVVPDKILQFAEDPFKARDNYDKMNLEGIIQDFNSRILYTRAGETPDGSEVKPLAERKPTLATEYVFNAGGTGSGLTEAWLFEFGPAAFHFIYGKHTSPGIQNEDKGVFNRPAPGGGYHDVWVRRYDVNCGIVEGSKGSFMRLVNIDPNMTQPAQEAMVSMIIKGMKPFLPTPGGANAVLFVPRAVYGIIEDTAFRKANVNITISEFANFGLLPRVAGIPVRPWDAIATNMTAVA
jgi:hypothetical protein